MNVLYEKGVAKKVHWKKEKCLYRLRQTLCDIMQQNMQHLLKMTTQLSCHSATGIYFKIHLNYIRMKHKNIFQLWFYENQLSWAQISVFHVLDSGRPGGLALWLWLLSLGEWIDLVIFCLESDSNSHLINIFDPNSWNIIESLPQNWLNWIMI